MSKALWGDKLTCIKAAIFLEKTKIPYIGKLYAFIPFQLCKLKKFKYIGASPRKLDNVSLWIVKCQKIHPYINDTTAPFEKTHRKDLLQKKLYVSFALYDFVHLILYCLLEVDEWYPSTKPIQFEIWASIF